MSFRKNVLLTPSIRQSLCDNLHAILERDRRHITMSSICSISGSIFLDKALEIYFPNDPRWDYGVGVILSNRSERVDWIEVHSANSLHNISEMMRKLSWLKNWINSNAQGFNRMHRKYVWIASGKTAYRAGSKQRIRIANAGIIFVGNKYFIS